MAWASKKLYAILMNSEEGKDILEGMAEKSQEEFEKEVDAFFGEGGKGASQNADYKKAKEVSGSSKDKMVDGDLEEEIGMDRGLDGLSKEEQNQEGCQRL